MSQNLIEQLYTSILRLPDSFSTNRRNKKELFLATQAASKAVLDGLRAKKAEDWQYVLQGMNSVYPVEKIAQILEDLYKSTRCKSWGRQPQVTRLQDAKKNSITFAVEKGNLEPFNAQIGHLHFLFRRYDDPDFSLLQERYIAYLERSLFHNFNWVSMIPHTNDREPKILDIYYSSAPIVATPPLNAEYGSPDEDRNYRSQFSRFSSFDFDFDINEQTFRFETYISNGRTIDM